ncbi:MAG: transposase family protein [Candidatus Paceibacteria bacterium]
MSLGTRRNLVDRWRAEYTLAGKKERGRILDSLCEAAGWNRKYAMAAIKELPALRPKQRRKRKRRYGVNEEAALVKVWKLSDFLASKRLAPFMEEFLEALDRHEELKLPEPTRSKLITMSASTMDRLLRRHRSSHPRPQSLTRSGPLLKKQVKIRLGTEWDDDRPGFCEVDTVAHCGGDLSEGYFFTLSLTDVATGWTECAPLRHKGQQETLARLKGIVARMPFELLGVDSDNGSEFMNYHLLKFCEDGKVKFTRCRPYHKNDQCYIEQKNSSVVRRHAGYGRYDTDKQFGLLTGLYGTLRLLVNFFEPSIKGKSKAMTPYRRLLASKLLNEEQLRDLEETYLALNPIALRRELLKTKMELFELESLVSFLDEATV